MPIVLCCYPQRLRPAPRRVGRDDLDVIRARPGGGGRDGERPGRDFFPARAQALIFFLAAAELSRCGSRWTNSTNSTESRARPAAQRTAHTIAASFTPSRLPSRSSFSQVVASSCAGSVAAICLLAPASARGAAGGAVARTDGRQTHLWAHMYVCLSVMYRENGGRCRECRLSV